jgi:hypothetical protein
MFDHSVEWPKIDYDRWAGARQTRELSSSPAPRYYWMVLGLNKRSLKTFNRIHLDDAHWCISQSILHV